MTACPNSGTPNSALPTANLVVEATSGTIDQQGRAFTHAFEIHLERATLAFDFAVIGGAGRYLCEPMLLDSNGKVEHPKLPGGDPIDAFVNELREVTRSVSEGKTSEILGAILAQDAIRLCEKQSESLRQSAAAGQDLSTNPIVIVPR